MPQIEITLASAAEKPVLGNLIQLYIHDFSEHWSGTPQGDLGDDGRYAEYPHLDSYWRDAARVPLLLRTGGKLIGFALINDHAHGDGQVDRNMAEFFIVRKHRRSGFGTAAAHAIFDRYPGIWETAVARRNVAAQAFWRKAITSHRRVSDIDERDLATPEWNGPVLRFRISSAPPRPISPGGR